MNSMVDSWMLKVLGGYNKLNMLDNLTNELNALETKEEETETNNKSRPRASMSI